MYLYSQFWVDLYTIGSDSVEWIGVLNLIVSERFKNVNWNVAVLFIIFHIFR